MKLSFSTNGWEALDWKQFFSMAKELGYQGVEIHQPQRELDSDSNRVFGPSGITSTIRELRHLSLQIPCIDVLSDLSNPAMHPAYLEEIRSAIALARQLKTPFLRLHAGKTEESGKGDAIAEENVMALLRTLLPEAEQAGATLLIETVGIYADTGRLKELLNEFACDSLGALWDLHHPYRFCNEDPETTIQNLGAYIRHAHVKDSLLLDDGVSYCLPGDGDLPIGDMILALRSIGFEGFLSLECDPSWLAELGSESIVFPQYVNFMSRFKNRGHRSVLYENKAKTGKYVFPKEELIPYTFPQLLDRMCEEFPDQIAFRYTTLNYTRTYTQFRQDVDTFARSLIALGVKPGDHVSIWATNVPQWYIAFWATTKIGAVLVTVNTAYKIHEAEYLFRQSDTHTLIMIEGCLDSDYAGIIRELCPELAHKKPREPLHCKRLPFLRNIITVDFRMEGTLPWEEAMSLSEQVPVEEVYRRAANIDPDDVANMQYTSGTTGFPKGVMLTHYNIVNNGKCIGDRMDLSTADRMMIQVPMFHCFGMVLAMTASMTHGVSIFPLPYFSAKPALACINQERITCFHGVPTMFIALLEHPDFEKTDFSYMRTGIMAGSPCPVAVMQDVVDKMHMNEITIVYGQTEASPGCTMSSADDSLEVRVSTVGRPLPNIECRIVDPETGEELPDGVNGEFVARGYNIMKGYYKMPRATAAAIDAQGWLHTGDLACRTPEGNYRITGRLKDMIIRGGENIYPKEIEEFVYTHPQVQDVQVIGVPDVQYGEEIMACVILKDGATLTEAELSQYVREHMAKHKVPRYIEFVKAFPMNAAGKILKYKMREDAVERLGLKKAASIETA